MSLIDKVEILALCARANFSKDGDWWRDMAVRGQKIVYTPTRDAISKYTNEQTNAPKSPNLLNSLY